MQKNTNYKMQKKNNSDKRKKLTHKNTFNYRLKNFIVKEYIL